MAIHLAEADKAPRYKLRIQSERAVSVAEASQFLADVSHAYHCCYLFEFIGETSEVPNSQEGSPTSFSLTLASWLNLAPGKIESLVPLTERLELGFASEVSVFGELCGTHAGLKLMGVYVNHHLQQLQHGNGLSEAEDSRIFLAKAQADSQWLVEGIQQLQAIGASREQVQILLENFIYLPLRQLQSAQSWIKGAEFIGTSSVEPTQQNHVGLSHELKAVPSPMQTHSIPAVQSTDASNANSSIVELLPGDISVELVRIPGGSFLMGAPESEEYSEGYERPQHTVTLSEFYMGATPITQAQWEALMGNNPSEFQGRDRPVEKVSWDQAIEFCQKLSELSGKEFRLPSEAEWEYACRAGTTTPYYFGDSISREMANLVESEISDAGIDIAPQNQTTDVGIFPANTFGLYDMHGNIWEWCLDHYHPSYEGAPSTAEPWVTDIKSKTRILRGGSWLSSPWHCRSAYRFSSKTRLRNSMVGFRVCYGEQNILPKVRSA